MLVAIGSGNTEEVTELAAKRADVNKPFPSGSIAGGQTPLMQATLCGNERVMQYLIEHHADVDAHAADPNGNTALHYAVRKEVGVLRDCAVLTALLCASKADVNVLNNNGSTPLHSAVGSLLATAANYVVTRSPH